MVAELLRVAIAGTVLGLAAYRTDGGVEVNDQAIVARTGTQRPRPPQCLGEHGVELADVAECEHLRSAKLIFRTQTVIDASGSGIHRLPGPQPGHGGRPGRGGLSV